MSQLTALLLTLCIELLALGLWHRVIGLSEDRRPWQWVLLCVAASLMTHPVAWGLNHWITAPFVTRFLLIEAAVILAEAALYAQAGAFARRWHPLGLSALANAASAGVGLLMWWVWWR